jgi:hypothetical protein
MPIPPSQYFGIVPRLSRPADIPLETLFLAGCTFCFDEHLPFGAEQNELAAKLRYYGAEVDQNLNAAIHEQRITHLVCDNLNAKVRQLLKHQGIRMITTHWLSDALLKRKVEPPTKACHMPTPWFDGQLPGADKVTRDKETRINCFS